MSKEYIEREAICENCKNKNSCFPYPEMRAKCPVYKTPAADVKPVVHAYWKTREEKNDYLWVECSNCGYLVENYKAVKTGRSSTDVIGNKWNACPICCAHMDGGNIND